MEELPQDITTLLFDDLDANALAHYCSTNQEIRARCGDKVFWNKKVRLISLKRVRRELDYPPRY